MIFRIYRLDSEGSVVPLEYTDNLHLADAMVDKYSEKYPHAIVDYDLV